ncbi:MAG: phosphatase PAP2 family protein [Paludibacter sp.]|nr:phosphatase PAP2 family protein [Paludibacter sp.]
MKEFVEQLLPYERNLFFFLNGSDSVLLDKIMYTLSMSKVWIPLYAFALFMFFYKKRWKEALVVALAFILTFALCDQISSSLIKPIFERVRPGNHPDFKDLVKLVNGYRGGGYGFISGHATNCFGFAVMLSLVFRNRWVTFVSLIWATAISYSRIYLGMHFVTDVVGGIIVGTLVAVAVYALLIFIHKKIFKPKEKIRIYSPQQGKILWIGYAIIFIMVVLYGVIFK